MDSHSQKIECQTFRNYESQYFYSEVWTRIIKLLLFIKVWQGSLLYDRFNDYENDPGICRYQAVFHKNLINPRGNEKNKNPKQTKKPWTHKLRMEN